MSKEIALSAEQFIDGVTNVAPHAARPSGYAVPALTGILIEVNGEETTFVATQSHTLAAQSVVLAKPSDDSYSFIAPAVLLTNVVKAKPQGPVTITLSESLITISGTFEPVKGAVIDESFPNWRRLLPTGNPAGTESIGINASLLAPFTKLSKHGKKIQYQEIELTFNGPRKPVAVRSLHNKRFYGLIMPVRIPS